MDYAGLQAAIAAALNRADLYAAIPGWITLAEAEIGRRLRVRRMIGRASAQVAGAFETAPADFAGVISVSLGDTGETLEGLSIEAITEAGESSASGRPRAYAVLGDGFQFHPAPDTACEVVIS